MGTKTLRTGTLALAAAALPAVLVVGVYLLTARSLGASAARLPAERPSVVESHSSSEESHHRTQGDARPKDSRQDTTQTREEPSAPESASWTPSSDSVSSDSVQGGDDHSEDELGEGDD